MKEPTNEHVRAMAEAAKNAAMAKAEELGFGKMIGLLGILAAAEAAEKFITIFSILGPDGMDDLGKALEKSMLYDMNEQAEGILRGE